MKNNNSQSSKELCNNQSLNLKMISAKDTVSSEFYAKLRSQKTSERAKAIMSKSWYGYKFLFSLRNNGNDDELHFEIELDRNEVDQFYNDLKNDQRLILTNFNGDPYNKNSFLEMREIGVRIIINPPTSLSGDSDWHYYKRCIVSFTFLFELL